MRMKFCIWEPLDNVFQLISGVLKSPNKMRFAEPMLALLRKTNKFSYGVIFELGGIYVKQHTTGCE